MRVGLVNNFHPFSGIGKYAFNLHAKLREQEKDVEMIYCESKDNILDWDVAGLQKIKQEYSFPIHNKTLSWYYSFPPNIPRGYDLYHASSQYLARVAKFHDPIVVTHMDLAPVLFPNEYPRVLSVFLKRVYSFYDQCDRILTISPNAKTELLEHLPHLDENIIHPIPLGFDEAIYEPKSKEEARKKLGIKPDTKVVLNIGSEEPRKNIPTVIAAVKELEKSFDDILFIRVGGSETRYDAIKKGITIKHLSHLDEKEMPWVYSAADVFPFPATYEGGFAYPPLEAMACGIPTIVGKELELFNKGATILKQPDDAHELAEYMAGVLGNKSTYARESARARIGAQDFTLTKEATNTFAVYEKALE
jgi:glycosyltransferase involved in cell wall biosynthesis